MSVEGKQSMLRSTLKRNLFPIALIALGCIIFLAIFLYLFRAHLATLGWVLLGLLMIAGGVFGIVASKPKTDAAPAAATRTPPSPASVPKYSPIQSKELKPGQRETTSISTPVLIAGGVLLVSLILVLLCNFGAAIRSLLTVHRTQIIDCSEAPLYAEAGWRFVSSYSYTLMDEASGYMTRTDCVMEREQFVWTKDKRASKDDAPLDDDVSTDDISTDAFATIPYETATQAPFSQPSATQMPLPTSDPRSVSSPLPTWTPPPTAPLPTNTPIPSFPTPSSLSGTGVNLCEVVLNDTYLNTYVQWEGLIIDTPTLDDEGLWFQVQWTNSDPAIDCREATFFVSYDHDERFYEEDRVVVTGTIIDTEYEYEGENGETEYAVVVRATNVEFIDEP